MRAYATLRRRRPGSFAFVDPHFMVGVLLRFCRSCICQTKACLRSGTAVQLQLMRWRTGPDERSKSTARGHHHIRVHNLTR